MTFLPCFHSSMRCERRIWYHEGRWAGAAAGSAGSALALPPMGFVLSFNTLFNKALDDDDDDDDDAANASERLRPAAVRPCAGACQRGAGRGGSTV